jgi:hypothetical protein
MQTILHADHKLGKKAVKHDHRTLMLARYLTPRIEAPPPACDWSKKVTNLGQMENDKIGDCTCAAVGHLIQTWTANTRDEEVILTDSDIVQLYRQFGYDPTSPDSDQGAVELDVLNYWRKNPVETHALSAFASVNPQKITEVRQSIYLFGGSYIGLALPITAQSQNVWTVTSLQGDGEPGSWGGHAVPLIAYDANYFYCVTWGEIKAMSANFLYGYCDESYALLSPDWLAATGKTPAGFDIGQLTQDLSALT